jgi:hypothetical protein
MLKIRADPELEATLADRKRGNYDRKAKARRWRDKLLSNTKQRSPQDYALVGLVPAPGKTNDIELVVYAPPIATTGIP